MKCPNCETVDMDILPFGKHGAKRAKCPECGLSFVPPKAMKGKSSDQPEQKETKPAPVEPPPSPEPKKNQPAGRSIVDDILDWIRS